MRVVTYNLLNPAFCTPKCLPHNSGADLINEWRFLCILEKLRKQMADVKAIICLQELGNHWCSRLLKYFEDHGYRFVYRLYGDKRKGYYGVGIAFPTQLYALEQAQIFNPADDVPWYAYPKPHKDGWLEWMWNRGVESAQSKGDSVIEKVKNRNNHVVLLCLRDRDTRLTFYVATYHMPCFVGCDDSMALAAAIVSYAIDQRCVRDDPVVFAGDFNITPESPAYRNVMMRGKANIALTGNAGPLFNSLLVDLTQHVRWSSAYAAAQGKDPHFTICTHSSYSKSRFIGCLDYVFIRDDDTLPKYIVKGALPLPLHEYEMKELPLLPSREAKEPSDHVMIGADLEFPHDVCM